MVNVIELGREHGEQYAIELWHADPADYDTAREWCLSDEAGTLTDDYPLPEEATDAIPCDLHTEGWSWGELADYQGAWQAAYYAATTNLMRGLLDGYYDRNEEEEEPTNRKREKL